MRIRRVSRGVGPVAVGECVGQIASAEVRQLRGMHDEIGQRGSGFAPQGTDVHGRAAMTPVISRFDRIGDPAAGGRQLQVGVTPRRRHRTCGAVWAH
ncbi:hypothetical protein [Micromonospora haikouensis]|uniref:hypothetical protein n=1 Tax=Micromonospora haikouensis TaxID=686309 RepID=UPI003D74FD70